MTLQITPDIGVPLQAKEDYVDLRKRVEAACNTAFDLNLCSGDLFDDDTTADDRDAAAKLAFAYAENPERTSAKITSAKIATLTPETLVLTKTILDQFSYSVVENSKHIRNLVTNKLIQETENPDPKVRLKALELLGKISDVGLFAEKSEVTITHQTTDDIRERLRAKLAKLVNPRNEIIVEGETIDVDKELGLDG